MWACNEKCPGLHVFNDCLCFSSPQEVAELVKTDGWTQHLLCFPSKIGSLCDCKGSVGNMRRLKCIEKIPFLYKFFPNKMDCTNSPQIAQLILYIVRPGFDLLVNADMNRKCGKLLSGATQSRSRNSSTYHPVVSKLQ